MQKNMRWDFNILMSARKTFHLFTKVLRSPRNFACVCKHLAFPGKHCIYSQKFLRGTWTFCKRKCKSSDKVEIDTKHMTVFILFQSLNSSTGNCHSRNGVSYSCQISRRCITLLASNLHNQKKKKLNRERIEILRLQ